jgi:hypothetical protein
MCLFLASSVTLKVRRRRKDDLKRSWAIQTLCRGVCRSLLDQALTVRVGPSNGSRSTGTCGLGKVCDKLFLQCGSINLPVDCKACHVLASAAVVILFLRRVKEYTVRGGRAQKFRTCLTQRISGSVGTLNSVYYIRAHVKQFFSSGSCRRGPRRGPQVRVRGSRKQ